jgi:hypothetical protein
MEGVAPCSACADNNGVGIEYYHASVQALHLLPRYAHPAGCQRTDVSLPSHRSEHVKGVVVGLNIVMNFH